MEVIEGDEVFTETVADAQELAIEFAEPHWGRFEADIDLKLLAFILTTL